MRASRIARRLAALALGVLVLSAHAVTYRVDDLGPATPSYGVQANAINGAGVVVGWVRMPAAQVYSAPAVFDHGTITLLPTQANTNGMATGIDDRGNVVGTAVSSTSPSTHAFAWRGGAAIDLGTLSSVPGQAVSFATGINRHGQICGTSQIDGSYRRHAFLVSDGVMHDLGAPAWATDTYGNGINARGHVVGFGIDASYAGHALLFRDGSIVELGDFAGGSGTGQATAINRADHVVGYASAASDPGASSHAFAWVRGSLRDLGTLTVGADQSSAARGINDDDTIVGEATVPGSANGSHAFIVRRNGRMRDLNDLLAPGTSGWELSSAYGINASGQITGVGYVNGERRAYLATPTP